MNGEKYRLSRRQFLRIGALTAAGAALVKCGGDDPTATPKPAAAEPTAAAEATAVPEPTAAPAGPEEVLLEIRNSNPEYENGEQQIWAIYQDENPHVKMEFFSVTEGASADAYDAKIAGGWTPAMDWHGPTDKTNYKEKVNLLETDFPWFDRYQYPVKTMWSERTGIPDVVPIVNPMAPFIFTWQYHEDLMEEAGLDPQNDVKTLDDMKAWLAEGTAWAESNPDIVNFWDQAWHAWVFSNYMDAIPQSFPDGQREQMSQAWTGEIAMNGPDSPYRHWFEWIVEAYNDGLLTKNFWAREWEPDMEANYIGKRSVMMMHGPWVWDKMLAEDPTAQQAGLPLTPPAEGQDTWMQYLGPVRVESGGYMHAGVLDLPEYPEIQKAYNWWFSPAVVKMVAELWGSPVLYDLDEPLDLQGPQWLAIRQGIGQPGGQYEDVQYDTDEFGFNLVAKYQNEDAILWTDWEWPGEVYKPLAQGEITVQEALDWFQKQIDLNYTIPG
jgi:ABC-type glycerol-3-phosphate transport system substrate-binding protein